MHPAHPTQPRSHSITPAPTRNRSVRRALVSVLTALAVVPIGVVSSASPAAADPALDASQFKGVNWARPLDNFVDGPVVVEGLDVSDSYTTVKAKAEAVYTGFQSIGVNTVRLPINTYSVPGTTWGDAYKGAIDAATAKGIKVILSYWEDGASSKGRIVDMDAFNSMWDAVITEYRSNGLIYFEPMNEPHGYSSAEWIDIAVSWVDARSEIPRNRIFISGEGYNDDVTDVCANTDLTGTYLSLHHYAFGATHDYDGWYADLTSHFGDCGSRTVIDEFGAPMDDGRNYHDATSTDNFVRYLRAETDIIRSNGMGAISWPALGGKHIDRPTYDWYSLFALQGTGTNLTLAIRNTTAVDRLQYAWGGSGSDTSTLRNASADSCLDVPGLTHDNTQVIAYPCWGGPNQNWTRKSTGQITVYNGTKCLDAWGSTNSAVVGTYTCNGGANQKWTFYSDGTVRNVQSGRCLDLDLPTAKVQLYDCWGGVNQKWQTV
jgi:hypothetical protein